MTNWHELPKGFTREEMREHILNTAREISEEDRQEIEALISYRTRYDRDYWKPSWYTWTQKTIDEINEQLRNQTPYEKEKKDDK